MWNEQNISIKWDSSKVQDNKGDLNTNIGLITINPNGLSDLVNSCKP